MNKDELIDLVFIAQPVWDKRHKNHHNRYVLAKEWKKIASVLRVNDSEAKSTWITWKNLRQELGKQMKKLEGKSGDSGPDETASSWPYFDKLQFLKDQFTPRRSSGNFNTLENNDVSLHRGQGDDASIMSDDAHENPFQFPEDIENVSPNPTHSERSQTSLSSSTQNSSSVGFYTRTGYKQRLTPQAAIGRELIALEREKLELAKRKKTTDANDEDVAFFNSLLPTVKLLPLKDKLGFRMKVQQLLYDTAFPATTSHKTPPAQNLITFDVRTPQPTVSIPPAPIQQSISHAQLLDASNDYTQLLNMDDNTINSFTSLK